MCDYWSDVVHRLTPYIPGEQPKSPNLIKLNTNENPYGPSPSVFTALTSQITDSIRLYPDPNSESLKEAVAQYYHIEQNQVFVGNGSDEVLAHIFQALLKHDLPILFPDVTYSFYTVYCGLYDVAYKTIPLSASFEIEVDSYKQPNGGIIFPNPNAPTGVELPLEFIESLLASNKQSVVVIDEAYIDFSGSSAIGLVNRYPNLLIVQTFSKSRSLAGLRVGFAIGNYKLIEALERVKNSFNSYPLDRLAISGAVASMEDRAYFEDVTQRIISTREKLTDALKKLNFTVLPSKANFLFVRHSELTALDIYHALRSRDILVRHFSSDRIDNFLRITVGTDLECKSLVEALKVIINPS